MLEILDTAGQVRIWLLSRFIDPLPSCASSNLTQYTLVHLILGNFLRYARTVHEER